MNFRISATSLESHGNVTRDLRRGFSKPFRERILIASGEFGGDSINFLHQLMTLLPHDQIAKVLGLFVFHRRLPFSEMGSTGLYYVKK